MATIDQSKVPFPSRRQFRLYSFVCDLYAPARIAGRKSSIFESGPQKDIEAADGTYQYPPDFTGVHAFYEPTPEFTNVSPVGLNKEENIFTSDKWHLFDDQEINDQWLIVMRGSRVKHPLIGRGWIVQGNSEIITSSVRRPVRSAWVYAKLSPTSVIPVTPTL